MNSTSKNVSGPEKTHLSLVQESVDTGATENDDAP